MYPGARPLISRNSKVSVFLGIVAGQDTVAYTSQAGYLEKELTTTTTRGLYAKPLKN